MAREQTKNTPTTTLNGSINSSVTTVVVADASKLSASPQFRIIVDSELMLVTGISGNSLTVVRGAESSTADSHTDGTDVAQILTKEGVQRYNRDWCPLFDDSGRNPYQLLDKNGNTLTLSDFTWVNQGTATASNMDSGAIAMRVLSSGGEDHKLLVKTAPTAPYTMTIAFIPCWTGPSNDPVCGPVIRDSTSGRFIVFALNRINSLVVWNYASPTSFSGTVVSRRVWSNSSGPVWLRIEDDNTNHKFSVSFDGVNFVVFGTQARTAFLSAPDQIGFEVANLGTTFDIVSTIIAFHEE